jgi:hypothetical protein
VAGEHERDRVARWTRQKIVDIVGCVAKQHDGFMRQTANGCGYRKLGVGRAYEGIVKPGKPESCARAFDGQVIVDQYGDAVRGERSDDVLRANQHIVITENGITAGTLDLVEDIGALPRCADRESSGQNPVGHKIAG